MIWSRAVTFVNATVLDGADAVWTSVRVQRGRIHSLGGRPRRGDLVIDAEGSIICPGFINAHDHLELNSFNRLKWRPRYSNVREWICDFQPRFASDPALADARRDTLNDRLWVGGFKNLLSGVTTVGHHNPVHRVLTRRFPVRVVRRFGLSHSLHVDGVAVATAYRRTPAAWPWIIHAAEGVDGEARAEIDALAGLACLGGNTVLVHGVAIGDRERALVLNGGGALVWCPSSNEFLFGETARVSGFATAGRLALGTDSRLSGEGDLLDELRAAARTRQLTPQALVRTVTRDAARVLRLSAAGRLTTGQPADLVMLRPVADDPYASLVSTTRAAVRLTMIDGVPLVGDPRLERVFTATRQAFARVTIDGVPRLLAEWITRRAMAMRLREPGLEVGG